MATIRNRGDGKNPQWEVRVRRKGYPITCRIFGSRADAEAWSRQIESEIDRGIFVRPSRRLGRRERRLEGNEEARLLAAASPAVFRNIIVFALETAMRRSEIARLDWKYIDIECGTAYLPKTKNGSARTVPLSPAAQWLLSSNGLLSSLEGGIKEGQVFGMSATAITTAMTRATTKAGIDDLIFHDLRHEAISRLFEMGFDSMEVAEISGYKTIQLLKRYTHLRPVRLVERLAAAKP